MLRCILLLHKLYKYDIVILPTTSKEVYMTTIYINKYISSGSVQSETFEDRTEATIAARRGDSRFNLPYSHTMVFDRLSADKTKWVKDVKLVEMAGV